MKTVHLIIKGKVQGVFYRVTAKEVADEKDIKGWVKNTDEGNVEIMASGNDEQVQEFIDWCRRGPSKANVTNVEVSDAKLESFEKFLVIRGK